MDYRQLGLSRFKASSFRSTSGVAGLAAAYAFGTGPAPTGNASITEAADALAGAGVSAVAVAANLQELADSGAGSIASLVSGTAAAEDEPDAVAGLGVAVVAADAGMVEDTDAGAGAGTAAVSGMLAATDAADTVEAAAGGAAVATGAYRLLGLTHFTASSFRTTSGVAGLATGYAFGTAPAPGAAVGDAVMAEAPEAVEGVGTVAIAAAANLQDAPDGLAGTAEAAQPVTPAHWAPVGASFSLRGMDYRKMLRKASRKRKDEEFLLLNVA